MFVGETQTLGAFWFVLLFLFPPAYIGFFSKNLALKVFCAIPFITQIISVPLFFITREEYAFYGHRPFEFTAIETAPVLLMVGIYMITVVFFVAIGSKLISLLSKKKSILIYGDKPRWSSNSSASVIANNKMKCFWGVVFLIAICVPIRSWMFNSGIAIAGTPPPILPYKLSGVLFYLFMYIVPLIIGYLYMNTSRDSYLLAILILSFAIFSGIASTSRGALLLTSMSVIYFAWIDRRWIILGISSSFIMVGFLLATASRVIVHISDGATTWSYNELGVVFTILET